MLQSLDVLVGFATIMLLFSMIVTAVTQYIMAIINSRGRHLRDGITQLVQQLHPDFAGDAGFAKKVADAVLQHPLISRSSWLGKKIPALISRSSWLGKKILALNLGTVIQREELTRLLMDLASGEGAVKLDPAPASEKAEPSGVPRAVGVGGGAAVGMAPSPQFGPTTTRLRTVLADVGISDPRATLDQVRTITLKLEQTSPELSNSARQTLAMLQAAESKFVGRIHGWFDPTMDRVSEQFTQHARVVTICVSLVLALLMQLDSAALISRLSVDKDFREAVVRSADKVTGAYESTNPASDKNASAAPQATPQQPAANNSAPQAGAATKQPTDTAKKSPDEQLKEAQRQYYALLSAHGLISLPWAAGWWKQFNTMNALPGILLSTLFLSLGAPFWYGALKNLLRFRSVLTQKDDAQRAERQTTQEAETSASSPSQVTGGTPPAGSLPQSRASATPFIGEAGDLNAVG